MSCMGGRERTAEKKQEMEYYKTDPRNRLSHSDQGGVRFVCDLQALKEASLKCQTTIAGTKPDCTAEIQAYRVSKKRECLLHPGLQTRHILFWS